MRLPSGTAMPVATTEEALAGDLKEALVAQCGLPREALHRLGLALGRAALDERRSLRGNDVAPGDELVLYERRGD